LRRFRGLETKNGRRNSDSEKFLPLQKQLKAINVHGEFMKERPFCDARPSMRTNVLLQKPKLEKGTRPTRDLPPEDFAFTPRYHDSYGVKEIFQEWTKREREEAAKRERSARRRTCDRQDFVQTNRSALRAGCVNAKEFREFKKSHEILVKPEENFDAADDEYNRAVRRNMVHGITTPVSTEMKETITWQAGREAVERARARQARRHRGTVSALKKRPMEGVKLTKAARGHMVKPPPPLTYADTFKLARFRNIDHWAIDDTCPARRVE
jgi:hypothetical protein